MREYFINLNSTSNRGRPAFTPSAFPPTSSFVSLRFTKACRTALHHLQETFPKGMQFLGGNSKDDVTNLSSRSPSVHGAPSTFLTGLAQTLIRLVNWYCPLCVICPWPETNLPMTDAILLSRDVGDCACQLSTGQINISDSRRQNRVIFPLYDSFDWTFCFKIQ